jgi:hypothetical protein
MQGDKIAETSGKVTSQRVLPNPGGAPKMESSFTAAVYYQSSSSQWSRLNSIAGVFEYEVDAQGNTRAQIWEWK